MIPASSEDGEMKADAKNTMTQIDPNGIDQHVWSRKVFHRRLEACRKLGAHEAWNVLALLELQPKNNKTEKK
jgi:hypothetical protein